MVFPLHPCHLRKPTPSSKVLQLLYPFSENQIKNRRLQKDHHRFLKYVPVFWWATYFVMILRLAGTMHIFPTHFWASHWQQCLHEKNNNDTIRTSLKNLNSCQSTEILAHVGQIKIQHNCNFSLFMVSFTYMSTKLLSKAGLYLS